MDIYEIILLLFSAYFTYRGIKNWYKNLEHYTLFGQDKTIFFVLTLLPVVSFCMILCTLKVLASFDVTDDIIYLIFYILLGFTWTFLGVNLVFLFFDLSWIDDLVNLNNKSALFAFSGAFLGLVTIYSGANVGDGPGWWCVIFAGSLGLVSWFLLGRIVHSFTQVFERITIERDINCGIRMGAYLLSSGLILGRASAGDWTSFYSTIVEFLVGWPVLPLTLLAIVVELYYAKKAKLEGIINNTYSVSSLNWCIIYLIIGLASIFFYPLVENPMYDIASAGILGVIL